MARMLPLAWVALGAAAACLAQSPGMGDMVQDPDVSDLDNFPQFGMSSRFATEEPMDLYGTNPSFELVANKSSWAINRLAPPTQKWWTNHTRFLPTHSTVLAYVTPWNQPAGRENAEMYRGKLDLVAPAWYSVLPREDDVLANDEGFPVRGGFPTDEDRDWVKRLQTATEASDGQELAPLKIVPRFLLEDWMPADDMALLKPERATLLSQALLDVIKRENFDGAVLESSAAWRAPQAVASVGDAFAKAGKMLVVVFPPFRANEDGVASVLAHAVQVVTPHVDFITVMTYDHAGPAGATVDLDKYNVTAQSPLRVDTDEEIRSQMREPASNQPRKFVETNLNTLLGEPQPSSHESNSEAEDDEMGSIDEQIKRMGGMPLSDTGTFGRQRSQRPSKTTVGGLLAPEDNHKVLLGMPLYGYTYPVIWINQKNGRGEPKVPPAAPPRARQHSSLAASKARSQGERKELGKVPLLRGQGEPMTHADMMHWFTQKSVRPLIYNDPESYEARFDYIAPSKEGLPVPDGHGGTREGIYYRAYVPSAYTMVKRREMLAQWPGTGAALWELGQAAPWLLHGL